MKARRERTGTALSSLGKETGIAVPGNNPVQNEKARILKGFCASFDAGCTG